MTDVPAHAVSNALRLLHSTASAATWHLLHDIADALRRHGVSDDKIATAFMEVTDKINTQRHPRVTEWPD